MASSSDFNKLMAKIGKLPEEMERNLNLLKTLNSKSKDIMCKIDKYADNYMSNIEEYSEKEKKVIMEKMQRRFAEVKDLGDDKVQLSIQIYEMVDSYIRNLDTHLAQLEIKMQNRGYSTTFKLPKERIETKVQSQKVALANGRKSADPEHKYTVSPSVNKTKFKVSGNSLYGGFVKNGVAESASRYSMPVDPHEPKFCVCQQVSFGQMIGCDNNECPIEWFHFSCVKLTKVPTGNWFCPQCKDKKKTMTK